MNKVSLHVIRPIMIVPKTDINGRHFHVACQLLPFDYQDELSFGDLNHAFLIASSARAAGCNVSTWPGITIGPSGHIILTWLNPNTHQEVVIQ